MYYMFSTIFTQTLQLKRRTYLFVATLLMIGIGVAPAQLLENEFHSPLSNTAYNDDWYWCREV